MSMHACVTRSVPPSLPHPITPEQKAGIDPDVVIELDRPDELVTEWCLGRFHDAATVPLIIMPVLHLCVSCMCLFASRMKRRCLSLYRVCMCACPPSSPPYPQPHTNINTLQQGVIYHPRFNPPPPEVVPRLTWRTDDTPETLQRRLQVYKEKTRPIYGAVD